MSAELGVYHPLSWDGDGEPQGHYVNGHVSAGEFRAEIDRWFGNSKRKPSIPPGAAITHVYIRSARVENDDYGNRQYEWRHSATGRPMTYFEVAPNRNSGG